MKTIFEFQEVYKALFLIHKCVDGANFYRIVGAKIAKESWDSLEKSYEGAAKMKKVKLQTMRRKYKLIQMEENETIADYFTKILTFINQMKSCGEEVKGQSIIEKILRTLTPKYDHVVVAIEESKNLEEIFCALDKKKKKVRWNKNEQDFTSQRSNYLQQDHRKCSIKDITGRRKFDKRKMQCYNCRNYRYYAAECKSKKLMSSKEEEARLVKDEDFNDDHYLLMATTRSSQEDVEFWYLDIGCSNHMIEKKDWFTTLDESAKIKIKFVDHSAVSVEGIDKVMIQRRYRKKAYISNVLYVPKIKSHLLGLGQFLEKGYTMKMKDGMLKVFNKNMHNILKAPLSANRTFNIGIQISNQKCLQSTIMKDT
ncbi:PREDICTED: uncharacterized protein LOC109338370 [Lupinus angustifolius]|uniref:uncharacterized protein LOC109338370 n=1 Tax=Lupinus angustifolius TaxID=3871 RepID=UPI00092FACCF|nr:PREDICTED: uncharacterized protein LOC109338370 [Lupinus angustifolius]